MRVLDEWLLLPQRCAIHEPSATAVIADVHLGYTAARQQQGDAIPARSVADELQPLVDAAHAHDIRALVVAGDLFERGFESTIAEEFLVVLAHCNIRFLGLVPGNHDRGTDNADATFPTFGDGYELADWRIIHGDKENACTYSVMGHWHPATYRKGRKAPCFLTCGSQLVLPAFSLDAAGVDIARNGRWRGYRAFVIDSDSQAVKQARDDARHPSLHARARADQ
jgi:putative SbcD/Mre11-related phosphoesterase